MTAKIADDMERFAAGRRCSNRRWKPPAIPRRACCRPKGRCPCPVSRVAAVCRPATQVGGDYYDPDPARPAAARGGDRRCRRNGSPRGVLHGGTQGAHPGALSRTHESPRKVLIEANRVLHDTLDARTFITITYAVFDSGAGRVTFARAGHSPPAAPEPPGRALAPFGGADPGRGSASHSIRARCSRRFSRSVPVLSTPDRPGSSSPTGSRKP